jgi:hypothetical protein
MIANRQKEAAALIYSKPPFQKGRMKIPLLYDGFFSFAVVRQIAFLFFAYMLNSNFVDFIKI